MQQRRPVRHALLSISDRTGIVEFTQALSVHDMELPSIGNIACLLTEKGLPVTEVSDCTGFPEMIDGCAKTLYPKVRGGILGRCGRNDTIMEEHQIQPIDMAVADLYPSIQTVARKGCSLEGTVENIDIGGPTIVRSAVKNHKDAATVTKSSDYDAITKETDANKSSLTLETHFDLAAKAFEHTAIYDSMIANYFGSMAPTHHGGSKEAAGHFPRTLNLNFIKKQDVRYDKDSHQQVIFYIEENMKEAFAVTVAQVQGKALSYNNIVDTNAALGCVKKFAESACMIVKHANPCGMAIGSSILDAYDRAYKTDSAFAPGDIVTSNRELDVETARVIISRQPIEVIIAPSANEETLKITAVKQSVCVLACGQWGERIPGLDLKRVNGNLLVRDRGLGMVGAGELRVVAKRQPAEQRSCDTLFYWKVARFVKSNAIVYAKNNMTVGIGAGQVSRVYSAKTTGTKAADEGLEVKGSSMASDAFFPFRGSTDAAAVAGVTCVIQPGGPIRDDEVITTTDERSITMLLTDMRYFRR